MPSPKPERFTTGHWAWFQPQNTRAPTTLPSHPTSSRCESGTKVVTVHFLDSRYRAVANLGGCFCHRLVDLDRSATRRPSGFASMTSSLRKKNSVAGF
jgi:hypothetical protein